MLGRWPVERLCVRCARLWGLAGEPLPPMPKQWDAPKPFVVAYGCAARYWWAWNSWSRCALERGHAGEHAAYVKRWDRERRRFLTVLHRWATSE